MWSAGDGVLGSVACPERRTIGSHRTDGGHGQTARAVQPRSDGQLRTHRRAVRPRGVAGLRLPAGGDGRRDRRSRDRRHRRRCPHRRDGASLPRRTGVVGGSIDLPLVQPLLQRVHDGLRSRIDSWVGDSRIAGLGAVHGLLPVRCCTQRFSTRSCKDPRRVGSSHWPHSGSGPSGDVSVRHRVPVAQPRDEDETASGARRRVRPARIHSAATRPRDARRSSRTCRCRTTSRCKSPQNGFRDAGRTPDPSHYGSLALR